MKTSRLKPSPRHLLATATLALASLAGLACGGSADEPRLGAAPPAEALAPETAAPEPAAPDPVDVADEHAIVRLSARTPVHAEPDAASAVVTELDPRTELGSTTALLVVTERDGWLQVHLPVRPNGSTGWVRDEGLERRTTDYRLVVDLTARTLTVERGGDAQGTTPVAIGADDTPTPTGTYFVTDIVDTGDPDGAYGPYALGLSAHSDVLDQFGGGDGQVGIHGTNAPSSIGQAASHGCIRVPNEVIARLAGALPLGTPVTIV